MIRFSCEHCGQKVGAKDHLAGETLECPKCGKAVTVPGGEPEPSQPQVPAEDDLTLEPFDADPGLLGALAAEEAAASGAPAPSPNASEPAQPALPDAPAYKPARKGSGLESLPTSWKVGGLLGAGAVVTLIIVAVAIFSTGGNEGRSVADRSGSSPDNNPGAARFLESIEEAEDQATESQATSDAVADAEETDPEPEADNAATDATNPLAQALQGLVNGNGQAEAEQPATEPDEHEQTFNRLFSSIIADAKATPVSDDDGEAAVRLLEQLDRQTVDRVVEARVLEAAMDMGQMHASGYAAATTAMDRLTRLQPERKIDLLGGMIELAGKHMATGREDAPTFDRLLELHMKLGNAYMDIQEPTKAKDAYLIANELGRKAEDPPFKEIAERLREARAAIVRKAELEQMLAKLAEDPDNQTLRREIVEIYLYEQNAPKLAEPYARQLADEPLKEMIALAATDLHALGEQDLMKLAKWYEAMGMNVQHTNRVGMLVRAKLYFEQFLARHQQRDEMATTASASKKDVDKELQRLGVGMKLGRRLVKQLRGEDPTLDVDPAIEKAIRKGVEYLYSKQDPDSHWDQQDDRSHKFGGATALVCYAMMMAEESPRTSTKLSKAIDWVFAQKIRGTYAVCFRAHLWEMLPYDPRAEGVMRRDANRIFLSMWPRDGSVGYLCDRKPTKEGDLSTTLAGDLTLWLAETNGIDVKEGAWPRICNFLVKDQTEEGMWRYREDRDPSPAMTYAGLTILMMALDLDKLDSYETLKESTKQAIERGLYWVDTHYNPNPGGQWSKYQLAALQHVGLMSGRRQFNGMDWYKAAAKHLVDSQAGDGSWGSVPETAFAVVFLARGGIYYDYTDSSYEPQQTAAAE